MNNKTEARVLADELEWIRSLTKFYISRLKEDDIHKRFELGGIKLNSAYWLVAHLVWTEHYLLLQGVGNKSMGIPWLEEYCYGSDPEKIQHKPDFKEVLRELDEVHAEAVKILNSLTDEELDKPNYIDLTFGQKSTKAALIKHCIRHEPTCLLQAGARGTNFMDTEIVWSKDGVKIK